MACDVPAGSPLTVPDTGARYGHMTVIDKMVDNATAETSCNCGAIRQAARRVTRLYDQALAPFGLRITQYPILVWLASAGPATMRVLADRMVMDRATLGHNLRPLEAQGLVTMVPGEDRRSRVVALTEVGRRKLREARPAWHAAQTAFEATFGPEDSAALRTTLTRLARLDFPVIEAA
jgi:DNA-binding MarR family transcriptional regulator